MADKTRPAIILYIPVFLIICLILTSTSYAIQPAFIKGTIHDAFRNSLIPGTAITTTTGVSTFTTAGTFSLRVPPDIYRIIFSAPGYKSNFISGIPANPGQTTNIDILLIPSSTVTGYIKGKITGKTSGKPIKNAYVMSNLGGISVTDEDGLFNMATPSGVNSLTVCAEDFESAISSSTQILPIITTIMNVQLAPHNNDEVIITGTITDQCTGAIITDADIICLNAKVDSAKDGTFTIKAPSGLTTIFVSASGYQFSYKSLKTLPLSMANELDFTLTPNKNNFGLVKGIITDSITGNPISDVELTTDTGEISFSNIIGEYKVYASICSSNITAAKIGYSDFVIPATFLYGISVTIDINLDPLATISGEITDGIDGHKIKGAQVSIDDTLLTSGDTDIDGTYTLENISPGTYTLSVSHECYGQAAAPVSVDTGDYLQQDIVITPSSTGILKGHVYDRFSGNPVADATVKADHGATTTTDSSGYYTITLPAECSTNISYKAEGYITSTHYNFEADSSIPKEVDVRLTYCPILFSLSETTRTSASKLSMLEAFRNYRNLILVNNNPLKKHVLAYYKNAFEITSILKNNPELLNQSRNILSNVYSALISHKNTGKTGISDNLIKESCAFINRLIEKTSSRSCKNDLGLLIVDLKNTAVLQSIF